MDRYELRRLDYSLSDDHQALQAAYKDFFKTHCPIETVRAAEESGLDKSLWERLCGMDEPRDQQRERPADHGNVHGIPPPP